MKIVKSSNARVDLCGGTLDLWPLSVLIDEAKTYNCSISCKTEVSYEPNDKALNILVESPDFKEAYEFSSLEELFSSTDSKLSLLQEAFKAFKAESAQLNLNGHWHVKSESPAGSGLGGSSSLLISMVKVLAELSNIKMDLYTMVTWAKNIETRVLKKPAGVQDYYPAVNPGLGCLSFTAAGDEHRILDKSLLEFLNSHLIVVDSQIKHHSGMNNWDIFKKYIEGDKPVMEALNELSSISHTFEEKLQKKDLSLIKELFNKELEARKKVSDSYFTKELSEYCDQFLEMDDVLSFKVCGAGGGGCLLLLCDAGAKQSVIEKLKSNSLAVLPFELVS